MIVNVIVEKTKSNWCAHTPDDIGVIIATGETREIVIDSFRSALRAFIDSVKADGFEPPQVDGINVQELMAV
jgi:predicted RNase H-like HicB family nuclease